MENISRNMADVVMRDFRHDFRNTGVTLLAVLDLARRTSGKYPDDTDLTKLLQGLEQALSEFRVVRDRMEEIKTLGIHPCYESIDIRTTLEQVAREMDLQSNDTFRFEMVCPTVLCHADLCLLKMVLRQVLQNAIHSLVGRDNKLGKISVTVDKDESRKIATIRITDNGCGIPADILEKIFEPGFSHGKTGHSGMGMALVQEALSLLSGSINISSQERQGTTMIVSLPWHPENS